MPSRMALRTIASLFIMFWTPAFAGVTTKETFYESIKFLNDKGPGLSTAMFWPYFLLTSSRDDVN